MLLTGNDNFVKVAEIAGVYSVVIMCDIFGLQFFIFITSLKECEDTFNNEN